MAEYNFDSFDEGVKSHQEPKKEDTSQYNFDSFDAAHNAALVNTPSRYAPEDQSKVSSTEAFGLNWGGPVTGIKQGATLGFGDEIAALSGALGAKSGGDDRGFFEVYKDILDGTRREQAQVNEDHGTATTLGELAGGFVSPLSIVGAGAPLAKGAGFLAKAGKMAKVGAVGGAAIGLGNSQADLTDGDSDELVQAAKDVGSSAAGGAALGAGMQAIGSTVMATGRGIGHLVSKSPIAEKVMKVFSKTRGGVELLGQAENFSKANRDLSHSIIDDLTKLQQESGKAMGAATDQLNKTNSKVNVQKVVEDLRTKLASLKASHPDEKAEIEAFKQTLGNLIDEAEQTSVSFIKKPSNPNLIDAETKAERTVAQKTAEAEVKDAMRAQKVQDALESEIQQEEPNLKEIARLNKLLKKVSGNTEFPAQTIIDDVTGLPVKAVDRGANRAPIASAVMAPPEPILTPLQKVKTTTTVAGSPKASPEDTLKLIRSLRQGVDSSETKVGKEVFGMGKDALDAELKVTMANAKPAPGAPPIADTMASYDVAKGGFSDAVSSKEMLGLPKHYDTFDNAAKVTDTNRIQNLIRDYQQGKQKSQVVDEALDRLGQSFPEKAKQMRAAIAEGSENEFLSNQISKGSEFANDPKKLLATGKSAVLQGARLAGKAALKIDNASKAITSLGERVYNSSPESIQGLANRAGASGKSFANALSGIANAPMSRRKAVLFTLMQQKDFRDFAHEHVPFTGDGSEDTVK